MDQHIYLGDIAEDDGGGHVQLDIEETLGVHTAVIANNGGGKSGMIRVQAEGYLARGVQTIFLDPEDEFYTLREKAEILVLGGVNGDAPATVRNAAALADTLLRTGMSAVIQLNSLGLHQQQDFVAVFIEAVMAAPQELWHRVVFVLDEVHRYAPQDGTVSSSAAVEDLVARGRKRGYSAILSTQRMAKIDKNVTGEVNLWFLGRVGQATDRKVVADALGFAPSSGEARGLQTLARRMFWAFGAAIGGGPTLFRVRDAETTMVKAGEAKVPTPPAPAAMAGMLAALADAAKPPPEPAAAPAKDGEPAPAVDVERIKADAYAAGRAEGFTAGRAEGLEQGHARGAAAAFEAAKAQAMKAVSSIIDSAILGAGAIPPMVIRDPGPEVLARIKELPRSREAIFVPSDKDLATMEPAPSEVPATPAADGAPAPLGRMAKRMIEFYDQVWPKAVPYETAAKHAGVGIASSSFTKIRAEVINSGLVDSLGGHVYRAKEPTDAARARNQGTHAVLESYSRNLGVGANRRAMEMFRDNPEREFNATELGAMIGSSPNSSTPGAAIKELRELEIIVPGSGHGLYRLAEMFR